MEIGPTSLESQKKKKKKNTDALSEAEDLVSMKVKQGGEGEK